MIKCYAWNTPDKPNTILSFESTGATIYGDIIFNNITGKSDNTVTFKNGGGVVFSTKAEFNGGIYGSVSFYDRDENTSSSVNFYNTNMVTFNGPTVLFSGSKGVTFSNTGEVTFNTGVQFKHDNSLKSLGKLAFEDEVKKTILM